MGCFEPAKGRLLRANTTKGSPMGPRGEFWEFWGAPHGPWGHGGIFLSSGAPGEIKNNIKIPFPEPPRYRREEGEEENKDEEDDK